MLNNFCIYVQVLLEFDVRMQFEMVEDSKNEEKKLHPQIRQKYFK